MADEPVKLETSLYDIIHRLKQLEGTVQKIDTDLYKGNGKSALLVRMEKVEDNLSLQTSMIREEALANKEFRRVMYQDIQALKSSEAFQRGKDEADYRNNRNQLKLHHLIIGILAMIVAPIIVQLLMHIFHWR